MSGPMTWPGCGAGFVEAPSPPFAAPAGQHDANASTTIVQDVASLFSACGFEVREGGGQFAIVGSIDAAGTLVEAVIDHFSATTAASASGSHHLTPENIEALIADLKACEEGGEVPSIFDRDWRTRSGVLHRVIEHLYRATAASLVPRVGGHDEPKEPK